MTRKRGKIKPKQKSESSHKSEDEILYCVCRSSDGTRFMIACDNCEEWYHGDCINVTPKQANNIKKFYCHLCIGRNPGLEIEYKTIKETRPRAPNLRQQIKKINFSSDEENDADMSSSSTPDKSFISGKSIKKSIRKRSRNSISESSKSAVASNLKKKRGRPREKQDDYDEEATEDEIETAGIAPPQNDCNPLGIGDEPNDPASLFGAKQSKYCRNLSKMCGLCDGCKAPCCGKCDICVKFHATGIGSKWNCRKKICHRLRSPLYQYHNSRFDDDLDNILDERNFVRQTNASDYDIREIRQRIMNPDASKIPGNGSNANRATLGSKMRRGDHLPGGGNSNNMSRRMTSSISTGNAVVSTAAQSMNLKFYDDDQCLDISNGSSTGGNTAASLSTNYHQHPLHRFQHHSTNTSRLSRNNQSNSVPHNRRSRNSNTDSILNNNSSSIAISSINPQLSYEESDEDVMIPAEFTTGRRHLSENDGRNLINVTPRPNRNPVNSDYHKQNYGLSYPDHLYCKHHRFYNWHNSSGSSTGNLTNTANGSNTTGLPLSDIVGGSVCRSSTSGAVTGGAGSTVSHSEETVDFPSTNTTGASPPCIDDLSSTYMLLENPTSQSTPNAVTTRSKYQHPHQVSKTASLKHLTSNNTNSQIDTGTTDSTSASFVTVYTSNSANQPTAASVVGSAASNTGYSIIDLNHTHHLVTSSQNNPEPNNNNTSVFSNKNSINNTPSVKNNQTISTNAQNSSQEFYTINDDDSLEINWPKDTVSL